MTPTRTTTTSPVQAPPAGPTAMRWARAALALGFASSIAFAAISVRVTTTSGGGRFQHGGDYWYTAIGIPSALAEMVLLVALWILQDGRAGRLAATGIMLTVAALTVLTAQLATSVALGVEEQWGLTYVVGTLITFVGHGLFVAGSWRTGVLPRWLLGVWPVVWVIGSFAAAGFTPLLLAAFYAVMAVVLRRWARQQSTH